MPKKKDDTDSLFEELFECEESVENVLKEKRLVTNEDVLFMVGYVSDNDEVCTEGFITNRFAAEIAMEEAKNKHDGEWVSILEFDSISGKEELIGTFKVIEELVSMKITGIPRIEEQAEHFIRSKDGKEN